MSERNEKDAVEEEGEYTDSAIPGEGKHVKPADDEAGEYTDSELPDDAT